MRAQSLGQEDPLEKEMAIHSSTLAWKIPWTEEPGGLQSMGSQRVVYDWATLLYFKYKKEGGGGDQEKEDEKKKTKFRELIMNMHLLKYSYLKYFKIKIFSDI